MVSPDRPKVIEEFATLLVALDTECHLAQYWTGIRMAEKKDNEGARKLRGLYPGRGGVKSLAEKYGVDHSVASRWLSGERAPETRFRVAIKELDGIDLLDFDERIVAAEEPAA